MGFDNVSSEEMTTDFYSQMCNRYEIVAPNVYPDWRFGEMDIMGIKKSGYIEEIEIKVSKSDYNADFKKTVTIVSEVNSLLQSNSELKHSSLQKGLNHCNYFSFLLPEKLTDKCNIPDYAGLYIYKNNGWIVQDKKPKLLHKRKISDNMKSNVVNKLYYKYWDLRAKRAL